MVQFTEELHIPRWLTHIYDGMKHIICAYLHLIYSGQAYSNHEACFIFSMLRFRLKILATIIKVSKPLVWNAEKKFFKLHKNGPYADIEFKMQSNVFLGGFCQIPHIPRRVFKTFNTKKSLSFEIRVMARHNTIFIKIKVLLILQIYNVLFQC